MHAYVVGLIFSPGRNSVVLIRKNRPEWQKGRLNGIGGKIETGEAPDQAMARECEEETGLIIPASQWESCVVMHSKDYICHFYHTEYHALSEARNRTDELLSINLVSDIGKLWTVPSIRWIAPLAQTFNQSLNGHRIIGPIEIQEEPVYV